MIAKASRLRVATALLAACPLIGGCNATAERTILRQEEEIAQLREECGRRKQALSSVEEAMSGLRREVEVSKAERDRLVERAARLETDLEHQSQRSAALETVRAAREEDLRAARSAMQEGAEAQDSATRILTGVGGLIESARTATEIRGAIPEGDPHVRVSMRSLLALSHVIADAGSRVDQAAALLRLQGPRLGPAAEGETDPERLRVVAATPLDRLLPARDGAGDGVEDGADAASLRGGTRLAWSATREKVGFWGRGVSLVGEHLSRLFRSGRRWDASDYGFLGAALLGLIALAVLIAIPFRLVLKRPRERELTLLRRIVAQMQGEPRGSSLPLSAPTGSGPAAEAAGWDPAAEAVGADAGAGERDREGSTRASEGHAGERAPRQEMEEREAVVAETVERAELRQTQVLPELGAPEPGAPGPAGRASAAPRAAETRTVRRREPRSGAPSEAWGEDPRDTRELHRGPHAEAPLEDEPAATGEIDPGDAPPAIDEPAATQELPTVAGEVPRPSSATGRRPSGRQTERQPALTRQIDAASTEEFAQTGIIGSPDEIDRDLERALGMTQEVGTRAGPSGEDSGATQAIPEGGGAAGRGPVLTQSLPTPGDEEFTRTQPVGEGAVGLAARGTAPAGPSATGVPAQGLAATQAMEAPTAEGDFARTQVIEGTPLGRAPEGAAAAGGGPTRAAAGPPASTPPGSTQAMSETGGPEFSATQIIPGLVPDPTVGDREAAGGSRGRPARIRPPPVPPRQPRSEPEEETVAVTAGGASSGEPDPGPSGAPQPAGGAAGGSVHPGPARVPRPRPSPPKRPGSSSLSSEKDLLAELEQLMGRKLDGPKR